MWIIGLEMLFIYGIICDGVVGEDDFEVFGFLKWFKCIKEISIIILIFMVLKLWFWKFCEWWGGEEVELKIMLDYVED